MRFHGPSIIEEMVACSIWCWANQRGELINVVGVDFLVGRGPVSEEEERGLGWRPFSMEKELKLLGIFNGGHEGW
jgi:hypothetical protein